MDLVDDPRFNDIRSLHREGVDTYQGSLGLELAAMAVTCFAYMEAADIDVNSIADASDAGATTSVPAVLVGLCIIQSGFILVDRAAYLMQSVVLKLLLVWCSLAWTFLLIFVLLPSMPSSIWSWRGVFFVLKCVYWNSSAAQIRSGYVVDVGKLRNKKTTSMWNHYTFLAAFAAPLVYELRTGIDWIFRPTTLEYIDAIKLDQMYAFIYIARCRLARLEETGRGFGNPQKRATKIQFGCGLIILFGTLLWGPLLIFTALQHALTYEDNLVQRVGMTVSLTFESDGTTVVYPLVQTDFSNIKTLARSTLGISIKNARNSFLGYQHQGGWGSLAYLA